MCVCVCVCMRVCVCVYIYHDYKVTLQARISQSLSLHPSLLSIVPRGSSKLHVLVKFFLVDLNWHGHVKGSVDKRYL